MQLLAAAIPVSSASSHRVTPSSEWRHRSRREASHMSPQITRTLSIVSRGQYLAMTHRRISTARTVSHKSSSAFTSSRRRRRTRLPFLRRSRNGTKPCWNSWQKNRRSDTVC